MIANSVVAEWEQTVVAAYGECEESTERLDIARNWVQAWIRLHAAAGEQALAAFNAATQLCNGADALRVSADMDYKTEKELEGSGVVQGGCLGAVAVVPWFLTWTWDSDWALLKIIGALIVAAVAWLVGVWIGPIVARSRARARILREKSEQKHQATSSAANAWLRAVEEGDTWCGNVRVLVEAGRIWNLGPEAQQLEELGKRVRDARDRVPPAAAGWLHTTVERQT